MNNYTKTEIEIIRRENKNRFSCQQLKSIDFDIISDFRYELDLGRLARCACEQNNIKLLKRLININLYINHANGFSDTLLHISCHQHSHECAQLLIDSGANINLRNAEYDTALMLACENNSYECVRLLIEHGANVNERNAYGNTPFSFLRVNDEKKLNLIDLLIKNSAHE